MFFVLFCLSLSYPVYTSLPCVSYDAPKRCMPLFLCFPPLARDLYVVSDRQHPFDSYTHPLLPIVLVIYNIDVG